MKSNEFSLKLPQDQAVWVRENPDAVAQMIARAAMAAVAHKIDQKKRRESLLTPKKRVFYAGASSFSFSEFLKKGDIDMRAKVNLFDGEFAHEFLLLQEAEIPAAEILVSDIKRGTTEIPYSTEPEIRACIGENRIGLYLAHICYFLEGAEIGPWYMFHCKGLSGNLRVVSASWSQGWYLSAVAAGYPDELRNGGRVVSQDF